MMHANTVRARRSVAAVFFVNGAVLGSWAPQVPIFKERLGLSAGDLGLGLLVIAIGAVTAMPAAGYLSGRFGSSTVTRTAAIVMTLVFLGLAYSPTYALAIPALYAFGAANGLCDVAMNAHGVEVERRMGRPILSSLHGMFSLGGFVAAGAAGLLLTVVSPVGHAVIVTVVALLVLALILPGLLPSDVDRGAHGSHFALPTGNLLVLGGLTALVFLAEGAMLDWAAVYLRTELLTSPAAAAAGFAAFSAGMAIGRFLGDGLRAHVSAVTLVRNSALLAAVALALGVASGDALVVVATFAVSGLALSNMAPVLFGAGGKTPGHSPATGVAAVATCGYFGFLAGPPVIGFVAEATNLSAGFLLLAVGCLIVALGAAAARTADAPTS